MQFATFAAAVAARLGITTAVASDRVRALARHLVHAAAAEGERALDQAVEALITRGVDDVARLVAHGPHEQAAAILPPKPPATSPKAPGPTSSPDKSAQPEDLPANAGPASKK